MAKASSSDYEIRIIAWGNSCLGLLQAHVLGGIGGQEMEGGFQWDLAFFHQDPDDFMEGVGRGVGEADALHLFIEPGLGLHRRRWKEKAAVAGDLLPDTDRFYRQLFRWLLLKNRQ